MTLQNRNGDKEASPITLRLKEPTSIPIEADTVSPDHFIGRSLKDIAALPVYFGRRKRNLGDVFHIEGEESDQVIVEGDLAHVKKIGYGMTRGRIVIRGNVGQHTGACMRGGEIIVEGHVADRAGIHMEGGRLWIKGNAGHLLGAAYPGERRGVNRGVIIVEGNVGSETGAFMRRGLIVVMGDTGEFVGARMIAGSVFVFGHLGKRAGAGMKRGSIVAFGACEPLLPTYRFESVFQPVFIRVFVNRLRQWGLPVNIERTEGLFRRYSGDITALGKGEILIYDSNE
ncbi:MAG: formylmethanofuran dehydrogenase subunit C [Syntrophaceae bacterium]|nr:formylmethanofuran dehydrogenase subunit C [Syntrophaceae bacterium]